MNKAKIFELLSWIFIILWFLMYVFTAVFLTDAAFSLSNQQIMPDQQIINILLLAPLFGLFAIIFFIITLYIRLRKKKWTQWSKIRLTIISVVVVIILLSILKSFMLI